MLVIHPVTEIRASIAHVAGHGGEVVPGKPGIHDWQYPLRWLTSRRSKKSREFRSPRESGIRRDGSERRIGLAASVLVVMVVVFPVLTRACVDWS